MQKRYQAGESTDIEDINQLRSLFGHLPQYATVTHVCDLLLIAVLLIAFPTSAEQRTVDFDEALALADSLNPDIRSARSRISELHHKKRQITGSLLPQIDASASYHDWAKPHQAKDTSSVNHRMTSTPIYNRTADAVRWWKIPVSTHVG
ncbi:MAG: hypothetical protein GX556_08460 [Fibrobacter sp.]|nr:hypothetical protein [Fibrobacter sp.]